MVTPMIMLLGLACTAAPPEPLDGEWQVKSVEANGMKAPEDNIKGMKLILKGDTFKYMTDQKVVLEGTFKADQQKGTLDAEGKDPQGQVIKSIGIMELKGDTMRICFVKEGEQRPKEFSAKEGSNTSLITYQRVKTR